jgi:outer membrane protein TolC
LTKGSQKGFRSAFLTLLGILATSFSSTVAAADYPDLPPAAIVDKVFDQYPPVLAAKSGIRLEQANRQRLEAGPHETTLRLMGQQRDVRTSPSQLYNEWGVGVERAFRLPGKSSLDAQLGEQGVNQARLAYGDALHEAGRALLKGWFAWLRERQQATQWQAQVASLREQLDIVNKRMRAGDAPRLERMSAEAALAQADAGLAQAKFREQSAATELLRRFPGLTLPAAVKLSDPQPVSQDAAYWRQQVLEHNHELAAARAESRRLQLAVGRAQSDQTADPTWGMHYANERGGEERVVGLSVSIPFGGQARVASTEGARAQADMASYREAAVLAKLEGEAENLFAGAQAAYASAVSAREAAQRVTASADLAARAYALGEHGLADVLLAKRQALEANLAATLAQIDANEARYRLLLDSHQLWPIDADEHAGEHQVPR